jgi:hypothetical protein
LVRRGKRTPEGVGVTNARDASSVNDEGLVVEADIISRNGDQPLEEVIAGR